MLRKREVIGWLILALTLTWPLALWGTDEKIEEPKTPIARIEVQPARVEWVPQVDHQSLILTVAGPGDLYIRQEFNNGQAPSLSLLDAKGDNLPDGIYAYELRVVPRTAGIHAAAGELRKESRLQERTLVQSGYVSVRDGAFVNPDLNRSKPAGPAKPSSGPSPQPVGAKSVTTGYACIGTSCGPGDDNLPVLRLKDSLTRITFDDVPDGISYDRNWAIQANDSIGGSDRFFIWDLDALSKPFSIEGNTPENSLYVRNNGNVGLGTSTPAARLEVSGGEVRFPPGAGAAGFTHFNYSGDGKNYIRGTTIIADNAGNVGIGTASPTKKLVVKSNTANGDVFLVQRSQADSQTIMRLFETTSGAGLISLFDDAGNEDTRVSGTGGHSFVAGTMGLNCNSPGGFDFSIKSGVNSNTACNTGTCSQINAGSTTFTACSSRTIKENLQPVRVPDILEKIAAIDVYKYDFIEGPKDRLGLMAEDFHQVFKHGSDKMLNGQDVEMALWLAVKELTARNKELTAQNKEISTQLSNLEALLAAESGNAAK